jgi:uncharacterized DUF497 family protein
MSGVHASIGNIRKRLSKNNVDFAGVQEIWWDKSSIELADNYTFFCATGCKRESNQR